MSQTLEICQVPNYKVNYSNSKKYEDNNAAILSDVFLINDRQYHERLRKDDNLILAVDVDKLTLHNPSANLDQVLTDVSSFIGCRKKEISYTTNFSIETGSHHLTIPKYWMSSKEQKQLWIDFKTKFNYGPEIDAGIFDKDGWFRLPNQTKEGVPGTEHKIQVGDMWDFILKFTSRAIEYKREPLVLESIPIVKKPKTSKKSTVKQTETNLVEFNEMNFIEVKHLINSGCFKNHCGIGAHNEWVCIGGMFKFLFPNNWFDLWSILTIQFGTDNKKKEYDNQSRFVNPIGSDPKKVMNTLRMWAKKENPEGWKLWVREEIRLKKINKTVLPVEIIADDVSIKTDKESEIDNDELDFFKALENEPEPDININYSTDYLIDTTIFTQTDYDFACVLHSMFKDKFVCVSITNKVWYAFENHKWKKDVNVSLRNKISTDMFDKYQEFSFEYLEKINNCNNEDLQEEFKRKHKSIADICIKLKRTNDKNNIMREAMELFINNDFMKKLDANPYLLCCKNGVIDLKKQIFREGIPEDCISLSTNIDYIPYETENTELMDLFNKIYPFDALRNYMINHLASTLYGDNKNQTFQIYKGSGSNGKSIMIDLMSHALGDYKASVPLALVCSKRQQIGQSSSEIIQLKGIRYAVMSEPSTDTVLNEGIMKEITGGDPLTGRALYMESETFIPQFSLACATNLDISITSNDDGTWRRIQVCNHPSKFIDADKIQLRDGDELDEEAKPIQVPANDLEFIKDKNLKSRFATLKVPFLGLLVKTAFENKGIVESCEMVDNDTQTYRYNQNRFQQFIKENIIEDDNSTLNKVVIGNSAKDWFILNYKFAPSMRQLYAILDTKYDFNGKDYLKIKLKCDVYDPNDISITKEQTFLIEFNKKFEVTNKSEDYIPSVLITEWAKLSNLKVSTSKEINPILLTQFGLDSKNKKYWRTKKIDSKSISCWFGIKVRD
jgi:P4 family phage/plasmid primase-like protien